MRPLSITLIAIGLFFLLVWGYIAWLKFREHLHHVRDSHHHEKHYHHYPRRMGRRPSKKRSS